MLKNSWLLVVSVLWLSVWVTNRYIPIAGHEEFFNLNNGDSISYLNVAKFCQGTLPQYEIPYHHVQRFFVPCLLGKVDQVLGFGIENTARAYSFLVSLLSLIGVALIFRKMKIEESLSILGLVYLAFNPYLFRLYNTMPLQLIDVSFVCSLIFVIYALVARRSQLFWTSLAVCALTRQTAILVWFPLAIYFNWYKPEPRPFIKTAVSGVVIMTGYLVGGFFAHYISGPNHNFAHMIGIFDWLKSGFNLKEGLEFLIRAFIPFAGVALLGSVAAKRSRLDVDRKLILWLFSISFFLTLQPLLGGPVIVAHAVARLMAYATVPAVIAIVMMMDRAGGIAEMSFFTKMYLWIAPILISFHHIYSYNGALSSELAFNYAMMTAVITAMGLGLIWKEKRV